LLLDRPVAPGLVRLGHVARADGHTQARPGRRVGLPAQRTPLADELRVEHVRRHSAAGAEAIFQDVELAGIARAEDDGTVGPANHAHDLAVIEPGYLALLLG